MTAHEIIELLVGTTVTRVELELQFVDRLGARHIDAIGGVLDPAERAGDELECRFILARDLVGSE